MPRDVARASGAGEDNARDEPSPGRQRAMRRLKWGEGIHLDDFREGQFYCTGAALAARHRVAYNSALPSRSEARTTTCADPSQVNGLTLLVVIALAIGVVVAYRTGMRAGGAMRGGAPVAEAVQQRRAAGAGTRRLRRSCARRHGRDDGVGAEKARLCEA